MEEVLTCLVITAALLAGWFLHNWICRKIEEQATKHIEELFKSWEQEKRK